MKQRAKVYKGKRVVMGDKNRVTKHEIHVNDIPQQGGESDNGNIGGGSASTMEYWDVSNVTSTVKEVVCKRSVYVKGASEMGMSAAGLTYADFDGVTNEKPYTLITAVAIDLSAKIVMGMGDTIQALSYKEYLIANGVSEEDLAAIPRITEEEFYTLN